MPINVTKHKNKPEEKYTRIDHSFISVLDLELKAGDMESRGGSAHQLFSMSGSRRGSCVGRATQCALEKIVVGSSVPGGVASL